LGLTTMEHLLQTISTFLDLFYSEVVGPFFFSIGKAMEIVLIHPLRMLLVPTALQVVIVAVFTGMLSISIRRFMGVEKKDAAFRSEFLRKKQAQQDLGLITDWKSREAFAKVIDEDIDGDFNTYMAERFVRHGLVYLLPLFFALFWLESVIGSSQVLYPFPENSWGIQGLSVPFVFLLTYCCFLVLYFRLRRKSPLFSQ
jgi:membrane protein implicated in regulation of membrane protease activity